jgi:hypothetical protein
MPVLMLFGTIIKMAIKIVIKNMSIRDGVGYGVRMALGKGGLAVVFCHFLGRNLGIIDTGYIW